MARNKELIFAILLLSVLGVAALYLPARYIGKFILYRSVKTEGISVSAKIINKGYMAGEEFISSANILASDRNVFKLGYKTSNGDLQECYVLVSKTASERYSINDMLQVLYVEKKPETCFLPGNARSLYLMSLLLLCFGGLFLLIVIGLSFYTYRLFRKRKSPVKLTSRFSGINGDLNCPECGKVMNEGYIPSVSGINWREIDEPVGLPNTLTGLSGTVFWLKRPLLHAYNCNDCSIVVFKYVKK